MSKRSDSEDLHIPVVVDVGPAVQAELASVGLAGQPAETLTGDDAGNPGDLPPLGEASQAELAHTLAGAERRTPRGPKRRKGKEEAAPAGQEPFYVGHFNADTPVYGCPGCAIRGRTPEDIMWHLRSYPSHQRR